MDKDNKKKNNKKKNVEKTTKKIEKKEDKEKTIVEEKKKVNNKKVSNKKTNTNKKENIKKVSEKVVEKPVVKDTLDVEENKKEVVLKKKAKKKVNYILLSVLGSIILFLIFVYVLVIKWYVPSVSFSYDYFNFRAIGYVEDEKNDKKITSEDGKCIIELASQITEKVDLTHLGDVEKIKKKEWAKQDFDYGMSYFTYHRDMLYIVQMYSLDEETFENRCKDEFLKIKKTFNFLKDE